MTISITHPFVSVKPDGPDSTIVQPSNWNADHTITLAAGKVLGRDTSGAGAVQELPIAVDVSGNVGIGTSSPGARLHTYLSSGGTTLRLQTGTNANGNFADFYNAAGSRQGIVGFIDASNLYVHNDGAGAIVFDTSNIERARIDASGNLGLGVTPSAWQGYPINAMQIGSAMSLSGYSASTNRQANIWCNTYVNTSGVANYVNTDAASAYRQLTGSHAWLIAPSGTAGTAISFTQAMTLDASGNLGIGQTSPSAWLVNGLGIGSGTSDWGATIYTGTASTGYLCFADGTVTTDRYRGYLGYSHASDALLFGTSSTERMRIDASGNLGIGTTSFSDKLTVNGTITGYNGTDVFKVFSGSGLTYVGTTSNTPLLLMTNGAEKARLDASGNLGLGVTPAAWSGVTALQIASSGAIAGNNQYLELDTNTYYNAGYKYIGTGLAAKYGQEAGKHVWYTAPSGTAGAAISFTQAMTLDASGNLGIGATPTAKLHLYEPTAASTRIRVLANGGQQSALQLAGNGTTFGTTSFDIFQDGGSDSYVANRANASLQFWTNNTERMRLDASGNLGIGTSSPTAALDVVSSFQWRSDAAGTDKLALFSGGSNLVYFGPTTAASLAFLTGGSEKMRLDASGNLGIGATSISNSPLGATKVAEAYTTSVGASFVANYNGTTKVEMGAFNGAAWLSTSTSNPLIFGTNNAERMRLSAAGFLGVGTTNPQWTITAYGAANSNVTCETPSGAMTMASISGAGYLATNSANPIVFQTNSTERLRIGTSGEIGLSGANYGTAGQVLTSGGSGAAPTWTTVGGTGTVTSVAVSGGTTGLTTSGGPITGAGTITLAGTLAVANGGTGATDAATARSNLGAGTASGPGSSTDTAVPKFSGTGGQTLVNTGVLIDSSNNTIATGFQNGYTTTATAAGTTTLTVASNQMQYFTGTANQTLVLPVTSTLQLGWSYHIANTSTGVITVQSSGANTICLIQPGATVMVTCILTSGTTAASWDYGYTDFNVDPRLVEQNAQTGSYGLTSNDLGKHIYHDAGAAAATYTIPANGTTPLPIGAAFTFVNMSTNNVSIAITTDTMYLAGTGTTGTRTLAQYGTATALKITATTWIISGAGLT